MLGGHAGGARLMALAAGAGLTWIVGPQWPGATGFLIDDPARRLSPIRESQRVFTPAFPRRPMGLMIFAIKLIANGIGSACAKGLFDAEKVAGWSRRMRPGTSGRVLPLDLDIDAKAARSLPNLPGRQAVPVAQRLRR
jgi:hypothetical protein